MTERRNVLRGEDKYVRYQEKNTDNTGGYSFATSAYSGELDTAINVRLQAMIELDKSHQKERENFIC